MNNIWRLTFIFLIFFLAACTTDADSTPTPFPNSSTATSGESDQLVAVEITELVENPEEYEGSLVMVNGRYQRIIPRVCSAAQYTPPSTWSLAASEEIIAYMSGFDEQLKSLMPKNTNMVVTGTWRQWRGPVGCGKEATVQDVWFLDVLKIDSPNPLTQITLTPTTPGDVADEIADSGDSPPDNSAESTDTPSPVSDESAPENPVNPGESAATPTTANPINNVATPTPQTNNGGSAPTNTPRLTQTPGSANDNNTPQATNAATAASTSATSATATPNRATTAVPTATSDGSGAQNTPQPTPIGLATATTAPDISTIPKGEVLPLEVEHEALNAREIHAWQYELFLEDTFTVTIASDPNTNIIVSILDEDDNLIVDQQDSFSAEELEIAVANNAPAGTYFILVESERNTEGHYAIAALDNESVNSLPLAYKGILSDGTTETSTAKTDFEDYWFFYAETGDSITVTVEPFDNNADMYIALYNDDIDPNGPIIDVDTPTPGATEVLANFIIPQDGVYMISTSDFDYNEVDYDISFAIN